MKQLITITEKTDLQDFDLVKAINVKDPEALLKAMGNLKAQVMQELLQCIDNSDWSLESPWSIGDDEYYDYIPEGLVMLQKLAWAYCYYNIQPKYQNLVLNNYCHQLYNMVMQWEINYRAYNKEEEPDTENLITMTSWLISKDVIVTPISMGKKLYLEDIKEVED